MRRFICSISGSSPSSFGIIHFRQQLYEQPNRVRVYRAVQPGCVHRCTMYMQVVWAYSCTRTCIPHVYVTLRASKTFTGTVRYSYWILKKNKHRQKRHKYRNLPLCTQSSKADLHSPQLPVPRGSDDSEVVFQACKAPEWCPSIFDAHINLFDSLLKPDNLQHVTMSRCEFTTLPITPPTHITRHVHVVGSYVRV